MKRMILWAVLLAAPLMAQAPADEARVKIKGFVARYFGRRL